MVDKQTEIPVNQGNNKENRVGYKNPPRHSQFKPGESGNPAGRPKDPGITAIQEGMLDEVCPYDPKGRTYRIWLAERGLVLASERDSALENLKNRLEGKVVEPHKFEGDITLIREAVGGHKDAGELESGDDIEAFETS